MKKEFEMPTILRQFRKILFLLYWSVIYQNMAKCQGHSLEYRRNPLMAIVRAFHSVGNSYSSVLKTLALRSSYNKTQRLQNMPNCRCNKYTFIICTSVNIFVIYKVGVEKSITPKRKMLEKFNFQMLVTCLWLWWIEIIAIRVESVFVHYVLIWCRKVSI